MVKQKQRRPSFEPSSTSTPARKQRDTTGDKLLTLPGDNAASRQSRVEPSPRYPSQSVIEERSEPRTGTSSSLTRGDSDEGSQSISDESDDGSKRLVIDKDCLIADEETQIQPGSNKNQSNGVEKAQNHSRTSKNRSNTNENQTQPRTSKKNLNADEKQSNSDVSDQTKTTGDGIQTKANKSQSRSLTSRSSKRSGSKKADASTKSKPDRRTRSKTGGSRSKSYNKNKGGRSRRGDAVLRQIRFFQRTNHKLIPKLSFCRIVKEILQNTVQHTPLRIQVLALEALQEASEHFIVRFFEESYLCSAHAKRVTLMSKDLRLLKALKYQFELNRLL